MERNGLPGASIVIVKDGNLIYTKGYGHDAEGNNKAFVKSYVRDSEPDDYTAGKYHKGWCKPLARLETYVGTG